MIVMLWTQNIWITVICVPYIFLVREKPEFAPSLVALEKPKEANFCMNVKDALKLRPYVMLMVTFMLL